MKKTVLGIAFIIMAGWVLLQGSFGLPLINFNFWPLIGVAFFAYYALEKIIERDYTAAFILGMIGLIIFNSVYDILPISNGSLIFGAVLAAIGLSMIFRPRRFFKVKNKAGLSSSDEISFGSGSRYINTDNFVHDRVSCSFGNAQVYFDNATIVGDSASFDVEVSFGTVILYVPASWRVELEVDNAFGGVSNPRNDEFKDKTLYVKGDVAFGQLKILYV